MLNEPTISVTCDKCGSTIDDLPLTPLAGGGWDARDIPDMLEWEGWKVNGDEYICGDCASDPNEVDGPYHSSKAGA